MRRLFPFPLLSLGLFVMWLLLNRGTAPIDVIGGLMVGVAGPLALRALELPPMRVRRPVRILQLCGRVLADIVHSNSAVARIIWSPGMRGQTSGFVDIPLTLRNPYGLTTLALIITATPGTLWSRYDPGTGVMTLHVLDLVDEQEWVRRIKQRYESLLLEIFV